MVVSKSLAVGVLALLMLTSCNAASSDSGSPTSESRHSRSLSQIMAETSRTEADFARSENSQHRSRPTPLTPNAEEEEQSAAQGSEATSPSRPKRYVLNEHQKARQRYLYHARKAELIRLGKYDEYRKHLYAQQKMQREFHKYDVPKYRASQARQKEARYRRFVQDPDKWYVSSADRNHNFMMRKIRLKSKKELEKFADRATQMGGRPSPPVVDEQEAFRRERAALAAIIDARLWRTSLRAVEKAMDHARFHGAIAKKRPLIDLNAEPSDSASDYEAEEEGDGEGDEDDGDDDDSASLPREPRRLSPKRFAELHESNKKRGKLSHVMRVSRLIGTPGSEVRAQRVNEMNAALGAALGASPKASSWLHGASAKHF